MRRSFPVLLILSFFLIQSCVSDRVKTQLKPFSNQGGETDWWLMTGFLEDEKGKQFLFSEMVMQNGDEDFIAMWQQGFSMDVQKKSIIRTDLLSQSPSFSKRGQVPAYILLRDSADNKLSEMNFKGKKLKLIFPFRKSRFKAKMKYPTDLKVESGSLKTLPGMGIYSLSPGKVKKASIQGQKVSGKMLVQKVNHGQQLLTGTGKMIWFVLDLGDAGILSIIRKGLPAANKRDVITAHWFRGDSIYSSDDGLEIIQRYSDKKSAETNLANIFWPTHWLMKGLDLDLKITPIKEDQEVKSGKWVFWSGGIEVNGIVKSQQVSGYGVLHQFGR